MAQAFDLAGITNTVGARSFAFWAKDGGANSLPPTPLRKERARMGHPLRRPELCSGGRAGTPVAPLVVAKAGLAGLELFGLRWSLSQ